MSIKIFKEVFCGFFQKIEQFPLFIITIYLATFFIYRDLGFRMITGIILLFSVLGVIVLNTVLKKKRLIISKAKIPYLLLAMVILFLFSNPSSLKDKENIAYLLLLLITLGFLLFTTTNRIDIRKSFKVILVTSLLFSFFILFFQVFKEPYWRFIYPLLSPTAQNYANRYFYNGYSISIGGITYTIYIIILGFLIVLSNLFSVKSDQNRKITKYFILLLFSIVLIISGRRGELVAFLFSLSFFYLLSADKETRKTRIKKLLIFTISMVLLVIIFFPLLSRIKVFHRYTMTLNALLHGQEIKGGISSGRIDLYKMAWNLFKTKPFMGIGFGNFSEYSKEIFLSTEGKGMDVHNVFLQLLSETGVVGTVLVLAPMLYTYYKTIKDTIIIWSEQTFDSMIIISNSISVMFQTFILVISLVDPINYKIIFWALYFICFYLYIYSHLKIHNYEEVYEINFGNKHINRRKRKILNKIE